MPRIARVVLPGVPHHVTQRGNNRQPVFFDDDDRRLYLAFLGAQSKRFGLDILGYCLMPNHVHIIATPVRASSLALGLGRAHTQYALHLNKRRERSGHLWQNRFFSCALDESHCYRALRYVELNPVRAKLVRRATDYRWSSASAHCGASDESGLLDLEAWRAKWDTRAWKTELTNGQSREEELALRLNTQTGRPLGAETFLTAAEELLGRCVRAQPRGRPRAGKVGDE
jgi:putative transposase